MSAVPSSAHVKAWRTRKQRDRMGCDLITRELALEVDNRPVPRKRRRFTQPALMLVPRVDARPPEPGPSALSLLMLAAAVLIALSAAIKGGFFDWRPGDQAVSTIDHSQAPHLRSMSVK